MGSVKKVSTLWEAHKACFCGFCIAEGSRLKKDSESCRISLLAELRSTERGLVGSPTVEGLRRVVALRNQIKSLAYSKAAKSLIWTKQKFYEFSNKPNRMLVNKLHPQQFHSFPELLIQKNGTPTHCPQTMTKTFGDFYRELKFMQDKFDHFIKDLSLPKLTSSDLEKRNVPISPED